MLEGTVEQVLPNQMFGVRLTDGTLVKTHLASEMKLKHTRLLPGDVVWVETSPYDPGRGKLVGRKRD